MEVDESGGFEKRSRLGVRNTSLQGFKLRKQLYVGGWFQYLGIVNLVVWCSFNLEDDVKALFLGPEDPL